MNTKKILLIFGAVLAFFMGQIFLESSLAAAGAPEKTFAEFLVPVFELVVGITIGYFIKKVDDQDVIANYEEQYTDAKAETVKLENELSKLRNTVKSSKKTAPKVS